MKQFLILISMVAMSAFLTSCGEKCETCDVTQVVIIDGVESGETNVSSNTEYCGDELDAIKATEGTTSVELLGIVTETRITVTCE